MTYEEKAFPPDEWVRAVAGAPTSPLRSFLLDAMITIKGMLREQTELAAELATLRKLARDMVEDRDALRWARGEGEKAGEARGRKESLAEALAALAAEEADLRGRAEGHARTFAADALLDQADAWGRAGEVVHRLALAAAKEPS